MRIPEQTENVDEPFIIPATALCGFGCKCGLDGFASGGYLFFISVGFCRTELLFGKAGWESRCCVGYAVRFGVEDTGWVLADYACSLDPLYDVEN